jgi:hypothetical protein
MKSAWQPEKKAWRIAGIVVLDLQNDILGWTPNIRSHMWRLMQAEPQAPFA